MCKYVPWFFPPDREERRGAEVRGRLAKTFCTERTREPESFYLYVTLVEKVRPIDESTISTRDFIANSVDVERLSYLVQITICDARIYVRYTDVISRANQCEYIYSWL